MAGMRALGRVTNPVFQNLGGAIAINMNECSGVELVAQPGTCTIASGTVTVTASKVFGSGYVNYTTANGFGQPTTFYTQAGTGNAAWAANTASWSTNTVVLGGAGTVSVMDFLVSEMADGYQYLKFTVNGGGVAWPIMLLPYDLTVQRTPANLRIISS